MSSAGSWPSCSHACMSVCMYVAIYIAPYCIRTYHSYMNPAPIIFVKFFETMNPGLATISPTGNLFKT